MPRGWVELALLMYRYIFILLDMVADLTAAQRVRLGYADLRRGWTSAGVVAGTVVLRSVDQAVRAQEAMQVRGYRGEMPFGPLPPLTRRDRLAIAGALLLVVGLYWLLDWRPA
jgi:cobalt/nickel transport system permease protein